MPHLYDDATGITVYISRAERDDDHQAAVTIDTSHAPEADLAPGGLPALTVSVNDGTIYDVNASGSRTIGTTSGPGELRQLASYIAPQIAGGAGLAIQTIAGTHTLVLTHPATGEAMAELRPAQPTGAYTHRTLPAQPTGNTRRLFDRLADQLRGLDPVQERDLTLITVKALLLALTEDRSR